MAEHKLPELLAPAGSPEALDAAISAGADAVYFGAQSFNARHSATNFDDDELCAAIEKCRTLGVKTNITLNTQLYDRELSGALELAGRLIEMGADALIVANLGLARMIKAVYPDAVLHASTQACGQNAYSAVALEKIGFSRMVAPRELSFYDIKRLCETSPIEIETFVHGALCVSFSGQCLMSSVIGGRSGNRGECAQPCRLPYKCKCEYPLSLKDSCLATHITDILPLGISSLKIEGRMKSPDYVYGVTSIYRRLLDEGRNASAEEMAKMSDLFSRSGFTDGYFVGRKDSKMLGIRTDDQKRRTASLEKTTMEKRLIPACICGDFSAMPAKVTAVAMRNGERLYAEAEADISLYTGVSELSEERIKSALSKCGGTVFNMKNVDVTPGIGAALSVSAINALRREVLEKLTEKLSYFDAQKKDGAVPSVAKNCEVVRRTAYFRYADAITEKALEYFDRIFVPLDEYLSYGKKSAKIGAEIPPIAYDGETGSIINKVDEAINAGCEELLITSLWQAEAFCGKAKLCSDMRLNVNNSHDADILRKIGCEHIICSPEIGVARAADIGGGVVVYGRLPIMTMEKCAIREIVGICGRDCKYCDTHRFTKLSDRTGAEFILSRETGHRNIIYNSVPVWMCDKADEIARRGLCEHFIFTNESASDIDGVITAAKAKASFKGRFKRI